MKFRVSALVGCFFLPALLATAPSSAAEPTVISADSVPITKQLPGGAVLRLSPGARLETLRVMKLQLGPNGAAETPTQVFKLLSGRVDVELPLTKMPKTAVLFQAPHKVSAVAKGGHSIAIADADRVTFAAVDNEMLAASGNDWKALPSGVVRSFVGTDPTPQEHAVPGVPTLGVSHSLVLATANGTSSSVSVSSVAQAAKYELSLYRVGEKSRELVRRQDAQAGDNPLQNLTPGHYEVSARALDSSGVFGRESAPLSLRIVGTELPTGARYENGSVLLGRSGRVKLLGAEGLEASYGSSPHYVRAPASVGLARGEATVVHLREPGSADGLSIGLEPRTLHADVSITPKSAHWPQDKIEVSVRLFDARGRAVPENVKVNAQVLVNVEQAAVSWARSGNVLTAQVPPASGPGPWVVRVEVTDEFGEAAGRDFLEVAASDSDRVSSR